MIQELLETELRGLKTSEHTHSISSVLQEKEKTPCQFRFKMYPLNNWQNSFTTMPRRSHPHPFSEKAVKTAGPGKKCHREKKTGWWRPHGWLYGIWPGTTPMPRIPGNISQNPVKPNGDAEFSPSHATRRLYEFFMNLLGGFYGRTV